MTELFDNTKDQNKPKVSVNKETGVITVGDKVFKSVEDLAEGKLKADDFIEVLKLEKKEIEGRVNLEQTVNKRFEDLNKILDNKSTSDATTHDVNHTSDTPANVLDAGKFNKAVEDAVNQITSKVELKQVMTDNKAKVETGLITACGGSEEAAKAAYDRYVASNDYDPEIYTQQMLKTPGALVKTISQYAEAPKRSGSGFAPTTTSVLKFGSSQQPVRNGAADAKLMQTQKRKYFDTQFQQQLMADVRVMKANGSYSAYQAARESTYKT